MNAVKDEIIIFAAGKIGRSFIGQLFSTGGFEIVFGDIALLIINELYDRNGKQGVKPRTYRRVMDTAFLDYSKKKKKSKATHRKMTRKLGWGGVSTNVTKNQLRWNMPQEMLSILMVRK